MPFKDPQKAKEYDKNRYIKKREEIKEQNKSYKLINKEKIKEQSKLYYLENIKSEKWKKNSTISQWKNKLGLISDNYDEIYERYFNSTNCEECDCEYSIHGDGVGRFKVMDHSHITGLFRNVLCQTCNVRRGA